MLSVPHDGEQTHPQDYARSRCTSAGPPRILQGHCVGRQRIDETRCQDLGPCSIMMELPKPEKLAQTVSWHREPYQHSLQDKHAQWETNHTKEYGPTPRRTPARAASTMGDKLRQGIRPSPAAPQPGNHTNKKKPTWSKNTSHNYFQN